MPLSLPGFVADILASMSAMVPSIQLMDRSFMKMSVEAGRFAGSFTTKPLCDGTVPLHWLSSCLDARNFPLLKGRRSKGPATMNVEFISNYYFTKRGRLVNM